MILKKILSLRFFVLMLGIIISAFTFLPNNVLAENQTFDWTNQILSSNSDSYSWINSTSTDSENNIYAVGAFSGTVDFYPNNEGGEITSLGGQNIFIVKYNPSGVLQWVKKIGGTGGNQATSINIDSDGNIYTMGIFYGTVDFNPDNGEELTSLGNGDIFVMKYNPSGVFQWVKQIGSTGNEQAGFITTDSDGNIYTTGNFSNTIDFDPDNAGGELTSFSNNIDTFTVKYNPSGVFQWVKQIKGASSDRVDSISVDLNKNVYIIGGFESTNDFDPDNEGGELTTLGNFDIFITKYNSSGVFQWVKQIGGTGSDDGKFLITDINGNVYTTGKFSGTVDFDPDNEGGELSSFGGNDIFIIKHNSVGVFQWVKQIGSTGNDAGQSIAIDSDNNIYTTGGFSNTIDFNPSAEDIYNLTTNNDYTSFILKLDSSGNFVFAKQLELTGDNYPWMGSYSVTIDRDDSIYIGGEFSGTVDFNTEDGISELTSGPGGDDAFLLKLSFPAPLIENPTLVTTSATLITQGSATLNGEVTDNGGEDLSELGFQIGLDTSYIMATSTTVEVQEATGTFSLIYEIDLDCNTTYHYRAYATNSAGTSYGEDMTFTTSSCPVVVEEKDTHHHSSKVIGSVKPSSFVIKEKTETPVIATTIINTLNIKRLLKLNMIGDDVKELQSYLNNHGYPISLIGLGSKGYETTKFGPLTKKAVIAFQKANGLTPDGIVGLKTLEKMK